jgi:hypothetical protein
MPGPMGMRRCIQGQRYRRRLQARLRRAAEHAAREAGQVNENRLALRVAKCLRNFKSSPIGTVKTPHESIHYLSSGVIDTTRRSFVWRKRTAAFNEFGGSENHRSCSPNSIVRSASAVASRGRPKFRMVARDFGISEKPSDKVDGRGQRERH